MYTVALSVYNGGRIRRAFTLWQGGSVATYYIETFGCEYNIAESGSMAAVFENEGFLRTFDKENCDVVLMNTCSIRKSAEERIEGHLGAWRDAKKKRAGKPFVIFTGCMAQKLCEKALPDKAPKAGLKGEGEKPFDKTPSNTAFENTAKLDIANSIDKALPNEAFRNATKGGGEQPFDKALQAEALKADLKGDFGAPSFDSTATQKNISAKYCVIDFLLGNFEKDKLPAILKSIKTLLSEGEKNKAKSARKDFSIQSKVSEYHFFQNSYEKGTFESFVPIIHGCNNFCAYCIVPYVRGREVSRPVDDILREIEFLSSKGVREVTLLGQNVNSYNFEGVDFATLLRKIDSLVRSKATKIKWVRFLSSHPKDLSDALILAMKECETVPSALHLPLQSGSDKVLNAMNRHYTAADYLLLVKKLREAIPNISLSTDLMTGFPGEGEADFEATLCMMEKVRFTSAMMYYYNEREGTRAFSMEQVPIEVRKARLEKVIEKQLLYTQVALKEHIGKTLEVLIEHPSRDDENVMLAKTEYNTKVAVKGAKVAAGEIVRVTLDGLSGNTYSGFVV